MIKSVFEKWIEINQIALTNDNYCCEYYIGEKCKTKVYFGIVDAIKVVYLEFDKTTLNNYKPVQINGLKIDVKQVDFISRDKEYICVENENNKDEIFIAFCSTLCDNLVDTSSYISAVNVFEDTIKYYKDFFSKTNSQLSEYEEQGLCAELLYLEHLIDRKGQNAVLYWTGPSKNKRDFVFDDCSIEIKSTQSQIDPSVLISNENQLDNEYPNHTNLYLKVYIFEKTNAGINVTNLIKKITDKLNDVNCYNCFAICLAKMKITFDYDARFSFSIQNEKMYKVVDDFPKITSKNIDIGIHNIQYRLYLDSLKQFEIEDNYE